MDKAIYSANKIAFMHTMGVHHSCVDYIVEDGKTKVYYQFPENAEVDFWLNEYHHPTLDSSKMIFNFLRHYKEVRNKMHEVKNEAM